MKLKKLLQSIHSWAPPAYQESYDNSGLIVGDVSIEVSGVLISLDCTEPVIEEAVRRGCNVVIAHHPIVFSGLKTFTGANYVERTVMNAIKNDIAIVAIHTNLDHISSGVNAKIGELLGIKNPSILKPRKGHLIKIHTYVPKTNVEDVAEAMFKAGAGTIGNYDTCSFRNSGVGSFRALEGANPHVGELGKVHFEDEEKLSVITHRHNLNIVIKAMKEAHPYEEVAYDVVSLENQDVNVGAGMYGELPSAINSIEFLQQVKDTFKCGVVKYTTPHVNNVKTIAWCGGAGSFLLNDAKKVNADVFITGDYKYHQFFDAEDEIIIADIGHFESEQYTKELIADFLGENFSTFAIHLSEVNTNPVNYL